MAIFVAISTSCSTGVGTDTAFQQKIDKLEHKNYVETIPGTEVKFEMIAIPGGTFLMGSPAKEAGRADDEGPQHPVQIHPFWMEKTETTWDEYDLYLKEKGVESPEENEKRVKADADAVTGPTKPYADETFGHGREGPRPVLCITHHAVMEYCRWLSAKTCKTYRLPTEAEWEYAARAGNVDQFGGAKVANSLARYAPPDEWAWYNVEQVSPVAVKKPNAWGLYDIRGNVNEWVQDWYDPRYYSKSPMADPRGPESEVAEGGRVVRSGSFHDDGPWLTRVSLRQHFLEDYKHFDLGFRLVREKR